MKSTATLLAALAFGAATAAAGVAPAVIDKNPAPSPSDPCAGPISYTNIELLYVHTNFDADGVDDGDGVDVRFEYAAMQRFYLTASVDYNSYDVGVPGTVTNRASYDVDQLTASIGIGGHIELTQNIHLAGDAGFVYTDFDYSGPVRGDDSDSETGWYVRPHLRAKWGCLTVHAGVEYSDIDSNEVWAGYGRLYYQVAPQLDITAGFSTGDEADVFTGGVRWRF